MVPRKSAKEHKVDDIVKEYGSTNVAGMKAKLAELDKEVDEANEHHEARVTEKTEVLFKNIKYYGSKVQELIEELVKK